VDDVDVSHTLPAVFVLGVVETAAAFGVSRPSLLAASALAPGQLSTPEAPVPVSAVFATWEAAMRALRDPAFPITYAKRFSVESYPVLGFAIMTAPTGREVFARVLRFSSIVTTSGRLRTREEGDRFVVQWERDGARTLGHRVANEAVLAEVMTALRCGGRSRPKGPPAARSSTKCVERAPTCSSPMRPSRSGKWHSPSGSPSTPRSVAPTNGGPEYPRSTHDVAAGRLDARG
jgi:Arabinose-binding domain of AraC transcription regulator, N-term